MKGHFLNALALAAVAGALNALQPGQLRKGQLGRYGSMLIDGTPLQAVPKRPKTAKRPGYYAPNQAREVARRRRQIAAGTLRVTA